MFETNVEPELNDRWTRLECYLPINNRKERRAVKELIGEGRFLLGGVTHSSIRPATFTGWFKSETGKFIPDQICQIVFLVEYDPSDSEVDNAVALLAERADELYAEAESIQEEIWMLVNHIFQFCHKTKFRDRQQHKPQSEDWSDVD